MRSRTLAAALACAAAAVCFVACSSEPEAPKPDVVVILIDTLRPDHLQPYGYERATSPFLSELASRGVVFERAYAASTWTAPSTASLFTGQYPTRHGITEGFFVHRARTAREAQGEPVGDTSRAAGEPDSEHADHGDWDRVEAEGATVSLNRIPDSLPTAPELFARAGYATFGVSCNVNITSRLGFDRGFDQFADFTGPQYGKGAPAENTLAQLQQWKRELASGKPYFLYLHFNDVHAPWVPRPPLFQPSKDPIATDRSAYDGEIQHLDATLRRMHDELGWDDNTLVCVLSDHGEEFGEHGGRGHGYSVHGELMRVTMMFSWPAQIAGGRVVDTPASLIDVLPTVTQLAGVAGPSKLPGVSLAPLLAGKPPPPERTLFALRFKEGGARQLWAAQRGQWKLIQSGKGFRLFDHSVDPGEQRDVAAQHPKIVAQLSAELKSFRESAQSEEGSRVDVELDAAQVRALDKLGYTDSK